jgi:hypothetical protein
MKLSLQTWNSLSINNGSPFNAYIVPGQLANITVNPVLVNRAGDYPALSAGVKTPSVLVIQVVIAAGQNINTQREILKKYFFTDDQIHNIVAYDQNDSSRPYYRSGIPVRLAEENNAPNSFFVTIQTEYPYWQLVTAVSSTWSITASAQTAAATNIGNLPIRPVFTVTPTTTKSGGLTYRRYVPIYNKLDKTYAAPMDITNGGIDTDALIPAKMQTSGNDFLVWMDGSLAERWINGINTATTKCWTNVTLAPKKEGATGAIISNTATTMAFSETATNLTFLQSLKTVTNYTLLVESEAVVFDPDNVDTINYQITGLSRGQKNTTAATHAAANTVRHIEHDLFIMYGDSTLSAPETNDDNEPIFDLTSTNAAWTYTNFYDTTAARPGAWKGEVRASRTKLSYWFTGNQNSFTNPSTKLGLALMNSADFTVPHEIGTIQWLFSHPAGVTDVTYSGATYNTASWPAVVGLQYLYPNAVWFTAQNEAEPAVATAWETFGPRSVSLGGTYENIRFAIDGLLSSTFNEKAMVQFDTVTANFSTSSLPSISVGSEAAINYFDFKLTNVTSGEWIKIKAPCPVNTALTIDCENKKAYLADGREVPVKLSSNRNDWLNLAAGSNTLKFEDTGTVAVTIITSHRDRTL